VPLLLLKKSKDFDAKTQRRKDKGKTLVRSSLRSNDRRLIVRYIERRSTALTSSYFSFLRGVSLRLCAFASRLFDFKQLAAQPRKPRVRGSPSGLGAAAEPFGGLSITRRPAAIRAGRDRLIG